MSTPLTRFGKRPNSRKSTLQQDPPAIPPNKPTSNLSQDWLVSHGRLDPAKDTTTGSPPADINASAALPGPSSPRTSENEAEGEPTEAIKPRANHNAGPGAGRFVSNPGASDPNTDHMQARFTPAKSSRIWDTYVKKAEEEDRDLVEDWDRVIDVTLVFAALFSAVSTGFVLESSKNLQTDQSKATVLAIRDLTGIVQAGINASLGITPSEVPVLSSPEDSFQPTTATIWVNCLWFLSLGLSISVSLLAMLAKRWCYLFSRGSRHTGTSYEKAIKRQETWDAIERWKMELVIEQLPTLMHVALSNAVLFRPRYLSLRNSSDNYDRHSNSCRHYGSGLFILDSAARMDSNLPYGHTLHSNVLVFIQALATETDTSKDWVIHGREGLANELRPFPPPDEDYQQAFCALAWILCHSKDKSVVQDVLEYINAFPEVILDCSAIGDQLYSAVSEVAEQLHQPESGMVRRSQTAHFDSCSARLIYLAGRPWLYRATGLGSYYRRILHLLAACATHLNMSQAELDAQLAMIADDKPARLTESTSWIESLAVKTVLGCYPAMSLRMCSTLGKSVMLLTTESSYAYDPLSDVNLAIWWFFLNCTFDCTKSIWPHPGARVVDQTYFANPGSVVISDGTLTLNYFRDSGMRRKSALWLTIVGISRMLYTFIHYADHEEGPAVISNSSYFVKLITTLRSALYALAATGSLESSVGELPVHRGVEARLFKFDSLDYGIAALRVILDAPVYRDSGLFDNLKNLLMDLHTLKDIKQLMELGQDDPTPASIEKCYDMANTHFSSCIWLASGLLGYMLDPHVHLNRFKERAKLLSRLVPDILFGIPSTLTPSDGQVDYIELPAKSDWGSYIETCVKAAAFVCMPHNYDLNTFRDAFTGANRSYMRHDALWKPLCNAGLIQISLEHALELEDPSRPWRTSLPSHATGHWLHIKASLVERLHSFPISNSHSPDILEWSVALSDHFAELLDYWDDAAMNADEQTYVIGSLTKLTNTLLAAPNLNKINEASSSDHQENTPATHIRLEKLIRWGVLRVLALPFSSAFPPIGTSEQIPDKAAWYRNLIMTIDNLARRFPLLASSNEYSPPYSDLVSYYEAPSQSLSMLEFVKRLRDDMTMHQLA